MPIVRYDIGDFAIAAHGACPCGRTLPRLSAILGRARNVFTFPDGSQHSPYNWRVAFSAHVQARQIQIVQIATDRIELRYIPRDGAQVPDAASVEEIGRKAIHPQVIVRAIEVAEIPRHPSGKIEDSVSLVTSPAQPQSRADPAA